MSQIQKIKSVEDILFSYRGTPVGLFLEYHNLNKTFSSYSSPQILVGVCMDYRICLRIPDNFAYIMRTGGANLQGKEFNISYAIGAGNVRYMALIGHNHCGMSNLKAHRRVYIDGMIANAGWSKEMAEKQFENDAPKFEIGNEIEFVVREVNRYRKLYPGIVIAPLFYLLEDNSIEQIIEE